MYVDLQINSNLIS